MRKTFGIAAFLLDERISEKRRVEPSIVRKQKHSACDSESSFSNWGIETEKQKACDWESSQIRTNLSILKSRPRKQTHPYCFIQLKRICPEGESLPKRRNPSTAAAPLLSPRPRRTQVTLSISPSLPVFPLLSPLASRRCKSGLDLLQIRRFSVYLFPSATSLKPPAIFHFLTLNYWVHTKILG